MTNVSLETINAIVEEMGEELKERKYAYKNEHLLKVVNTCIERKNALIELFSKHPLWNPEKLMIQFDSEIERKICTDEVLNFVDWLRTKVDGHYNYNKWYYKYQSKEYKVCNFIQTIETQFFHEDMKDRIDEINLLNENYKLRTNMKSSKAIGKICREEGWDKIDGFNQKYATLCDCLSPIKVKRHTVISLNPIDFLLMSNGNSWESCHDIDRADEDPGCYSSGSISYMLDKFSFVFYTVDASYDGNKIELEPKIQRQMFAYNNDTILQLRLYPQNNDSGSTVIYNDIRAIVQKVISDCLGKPNLWVKSSKSASEITTKGSGATCYPDWKDGNPGSDLCTISIHKEKEDKENLPTFILGEEPICVNCGNLHLTSDYISCCGKLYFCEDCGRAIYGNEAIWIDTGYGEEPYCEDCVTRCDECGDYHRNNDINKVDGRNVCDHCIEFGSYYTCVECGVVHYVDDIYFTEEDIPYCLECYENYTVTCEGCGGTYSECSSSIKYDEVTEKNYCRYCYNRLLKEREEESEEVI